MVSDQAVDMARDNVFAKDNDRKHLNIRKGESDIDIVPGVLVESKKVDKVDNDWFIVNMGIGNPKDKKFNILKHHNFPPTNSGEKD